MQILDGLRRLHPHREPLPVEREVAVGELLRNLRLDSRIRVAATARGRFRLDRVDRRGPRDEVEVALDVEAAGGVVEPSVKHDAEAAVARVDVGERGHEGADLDIPRLGRGAAGETSQRQQRRDRKAERGPGGAGQSPDHEGSP